jgi:hypothetical protein
MAEPVLRDIAGKLSLSPLNGNGNELNTRHLGAAIVASCDGEEPVARRRADNHSAGQGRARRADCRLISIERLIL